MGKSLFIAEKPSVAREFAKALKISGKNNDGYIEGNDAIVTWCVGHLVTMCYPEEYDPALKKWSMSTVPILPTEYKYCVIDNVKKQFGIVASLLNREDVTTIYVATDSGREGEYIYRLVEQEAHVEGKDRRRVWIDSQTEEEILRGVREAKDLSEYDLLADAAYLRAKADWLFGMNFSRALTLKYGNGIARFLNEKYAVVSVGRVMTCVLGMVVNREREIRAFEKTPFYRVQVSVSAPGDESVSFMGQWKVTEQSMYFGSNKLYKDSGFLKEEDAKSFIASVMEKADDKGLVPALIGDSKNSTEKKNAPLLYNLAELQNDCAKLFKISPDETLNAVQELYEKKLVTYPRTDARVLSTAVAKEIDKNLRGLCNYPVAGTFAKQILDNGSYKTIGKSRYTNDKQITDHYAIIPTGAAVGSLNSLSPLLNKVYEIIARRFMAIFFGPAVYKKINIRSDADMESFFSNFKVMTDEGYRAVMTYSFSNGEKKEKNDKDEEEEEQGVNPALLEFLKKLKKGSEVRLSDFRIKEGETTPPKRYNSGSMILAMENAGNMIEDEELREQIKGAGIGTSATRAEILKKLVTNKYLNLNKKTQIITPCQQGEMVYEVVRRSIPSLLNPEFTASWEKGLNMVVEGTIDEKGYMEKLNGYVDRQTNKVKGLQNEYAMKQVYDYVAQFYASKGKDAKRKNDSKKDSSG
ncbi:MAG: type IA DNA topoisomerase [Lachnospiraceae bacterium]|nr:type IA DNA topoisomerase [Lachnospiraceae bacterium]